VTFVDYLGRRWPELADLALEHLRVVAVAVIAASFLGVGLAILASRHRWLAGGLIRVVTTAFTIPSLALFGLLIPIFGLGYRPTVVALVVYALLPIVRNTIAGLEDVDPAVREVATGMGLSRWRRLWSVELPLAWPVVLAGIRVATMLSVGIAALAAMVNGPGLGDHILRGLAQIGTPRGTHLALGGSLGVISVALLADGCLALVRRLTVPRGLRQ